MAEERSTKGISLPVLLGIIVLVILMAAGTSFLMVYLFGKATGEVVDKETFFSKRDKKVEEVKPGMPVDMGQTFIANLKDSRHFVKVNITFEAEKQEVVDELEQRKAQVRDLINITLRAQVYEEVMRDPVLKDLKKQVINNVNTILTKGKVKDVWFTEFQVQ